MGTRVFALLLLSCLVTAGCAPVSPPGEKRSAYEKWQDDVATALAGIDDYLADEAKTDGAAIVLDIDNTALETEYHPGRANPPVLAAANRAEKLGMAVLIVTARKEYKREESLRELTDAGYSPVDICLRAPDKSKAVGKALCREKFTDEGYAITANIGNRDTDFQGGHFDRAFQLPDYDGQLS